MRSLRKSDNAPRFLFLSVLALVLFFAACAAMPAKKAGTTPPGESKMAMTAPEAPAEARAATDQGRGCCGQPRAERRDNRFQQQRSPCFGQDLFRWVVLLLPFRIPRRHLPLSGDDRPYAPVAEIGH